MFRPMTEISAPVSGIALTTQDEPFSTSSLTGRSDVDAPMEQMRDVPILILAEDFGEILRHR
ncbi:hypothetical protein TCAL_16755 [Tigriopus californicus]|uniref:Uncharacterized protein n=1 Tax=Tigriopus californicus TaxID=6832 RepID=A0A553PTV6_TIGCA|nr:hypothetical protein TCAL_16755 [Tigriopus californicus]